MQAMDQVSREPIIPSAQKTAPFISTEVQMPQISGDMREAFEGGDTEEAFDSDTYYIDDVPAVRYVQGRYHVLVGGYIGSFDNLDDALAKAGELMGLTPDQVAERSARETSERLEFDSGLIEVPAIEITPPAPAVMPESLPGFMPMLPQLPTFIMGKARDGIRKIGDFLVPKVYADEALPGQEREDRGRNPLTVPPLGPPIPGAPVGEDTGGPEPGKAAKIQETFFFLQSKGL